MRHRRRDRRPRRPRRPDPSLDRFAQIQAEAATTWRSPAITTAHVVRGTERLRAWADDEVPVGPDYIQVAIPRRPVVAIARAASRGPIRWEQPSLDVRGSWKLGRLIAWFGVLVFGGAPAGIEAMFAVDAGLLASQLSLDEALTPLRVSWPCRTRTASPRAADNCTPMAWQRGTHSMGPR